MIDPRMLESTTIGEEEMIDPMLGGTSTDKKEFIVVKPESEMRRRNNGYWHEGHLVTINCMRDYKKETTSFYFIAERGDERKLIANTEKEILSKIEKRNKKLFPDTYIDKRKNK